MENYLFSIFCFQMESGQGNLGTLANVVTSLANLSDSLKENLNNGSASDSQQEEQSASDITRLEQLHSTRTVHIVFHLSHLEHRMTVICIVRNISKKTQEFF